MRACSALCPQVGLVGFHDARQQSPVGVEVRAGASEPAEDVPGGLLRHLEVACELQAGDVLRVLGVEPHGSVPLAQRQFRVLEDRALADAELPTAVAAAVAVVAGDADEPASG